MGSGTSIIRADRALGRSRARGERGTELRRLRYLIVATLLAAVVVGCGAGARPTGEGAPPSAGAAAGGEALAVGRLLERIARDRQGVAGRSVDLVAYVNAKAGATGAATSPQSGCPVVPESLPVLSDAPIVTEFTVAGATLPNPIPSGGPVLRLVVPYELGIVDLPPRARLRGHLFDPAYAGCANPDRLFVLDEVLGPAEGASGEASGPALDPSRWPTWRDPGLGIAVSYPPGWAVEESRNVGAIVDARFREPGGSRLVRLAVTAGETLWSQAAESAAPGPLAGERQVAVMAGPAAARLVDQPGPAAEGGRARDLRVVLNYQGDTVVLGTHFVDGEALDRQLIAVFDRMVASLRFDRPVGESDPLDPVKTARAELGPGPFIGREVAVSEALAASGLVQGEARDARLVSERAARTAQPGACRTFRARPPAVWLVTVHGVLPTGDAATRLVYLDASTGSALCQSQLASTP